MLKGQENASLSHLSNGIVRAAQLHYQDLHCNMYTAVLALPTNKQTYVQVKKWGAYLEQLLTELA